MNEQIPPMPQPPVEAETNENVQQWSQYRGDVEGWLLRYKELPKVLDAKELEEARLLSDEDLFERYMAVADGGPLGGVWYNQLIAMRELMRRNRFKPWVQRRFLEDYIQTHALENYPAWPEGQKPTLYDRVNEEGLIGAYWPDVDSYYEDTVVGRFFYYRPVWRYFQHRDSKGMQRTDTHWIGEVHSWTTSLAELLAEFPHYDSLRKAHDEFVARWNLPTENVPTAGSKAQ